MIETIPLEKLHPSKDNPRSSVGDVTKLAASIASVGILEPLVVCPNGEGSYEVVIGHRRLAGAEKAGLAEVPAIVRHLSFPQRAEIMLIENLQREDLKPIEEARAYSRIVNEFKVSQRDLAERIGRSQSHISKRLALLDLTPKAIQKLDSGGITIEDAVHLSKLKDHPKKIDELMKFARPGSMEWRVDTAISAVKRDEKLKELKASIKKRGIKLLSNNEGWDGFRPDGALRLEGQAVSYRKETELKGITAKDHTKEPCHAATIDRDQKTVYLCTDPKRHSSKGESSIKVTSIPKPKNQSISRGPDPKAVELENAKRELEKPLEERQAERLKAVAKIATGSVGAGDLVDFLTRQVLSEQFRDPYSVIDFAAFKILGLDRKGQSPELLDKLVSEGRGGHVAMAIAMATGEEAASWAETWNVPEVIRHFDLLEKHGYQLSEVELRRFELDGVKREPQSEYASVDTPNGTKKVWTGSKDKKKESVITKTYFDEED